LKKTTTTLLTTMAFALAACGGDDNSGDAGGAATPQTAIDEIGAVRAGLDDALRSYAAGDAAAAGETVDETYLQHFELVEGPLEEVDPELKETLEEQIREELAGEIESGAPAKQVAALAAEIDSGLGDAEKALAGAASATGSDGGAGY
jgi:hypothetical protein